MAHFTTPEGKHYEAERATVRELLDQWHLKKAIGMTVDGEVVDCDKIFTEDTEFAPLFPDCEQGWNFCAIRQRTFSPTRCFASGQRRSSA